MDADEFWDFAVTLVFQAHFDDLFDIGHAFIASLALRVATLQLRYFPNEETVSIFFDHYVKFSAYHGCLPFPNSP